MTDWGAIHAINESRRLGHEVNWKDQEIEKLKQENRELRLKLQALAEKNQQLETAKGGK
jgi:hypothetical protein